MEKVERKAFRHITGLPYDPGEKKQARNSVVYQEIQLERFGEFFTAANEKHKSSLRNHPNSLIEKLMGSVS